MSRRAARRRAVLALALLLGAACKPDHTDGPASLPTAASLLAEIRGRQAQVRSLRGETKMDYMAPEGRTKVTVNIAVRRPASLRFEAVNPISGSTEGTLVADGRAFALLDVRNNRFLVGPALACNVARMTRIALPPDDVVLVLLGSAPLLPHVRAEIGYTRDGGGREVLTLHLADGKRERVAIDRKRRDVVEAELLDRGGRQVWKLSHEDFHVVDGVRLPRKSHFVEPRGKADIIIRYKDVEANVDVPDPVFRMEPPPGMVARLVGCADQPPDAPPPSQPAP